MMQSLTRANKDALFAKYINREPGTVIPEKPAPAKAGGGNPEFAVDKNHWMPVPCLRRGMLFGHDELLLFFLKDLI